MEARRLPFTGAVNFRDLGGYAGADGRTVRWRTLYRADSLAELTPEDLERLAELGIRTICDFRLDVERLQKPNRLPGGNDIGVLELGFIPGGTGEMLRAVRRGELGPAEIEREVERSYRHFPIDHHAEYGAMLERMLVPGALPMLMHCTSGKDRTGFGAAVTLLALGVPEATIVEDYVLSDVYRRDIRHMLREPVNFEVFAMLTAAQPKYLLAAFDSMHEAYGSAERYLDEGLGFDSARLGELRARLLETTRS